MAMDGKSITKLVLTAVWQIPMEWQTLAKLRQLAQADKQQLTELAYQIVRQATFVLMVLLLTQQPYLNILVTTKPVAVAACCVILRPALLMGVHAQTVAIVVLRQNKDMDRLTVQAMPDLMTVAYQKLEHLHRH